MAIYRFNKTQKAFTIVEVLVAVFLIAIGLTAAVSLISFSLRGFRSTASRIFNVALVQKRLEEIRNMRDLKQDISGLPEVRGKNPYVITVQEGPITIISHLYDWKK